MRHTLTTHHFHTPQFKDGFSKQVQETFSLSFDEPEPAKPAAPAAGEGKGKKGGKKGKGKKAAEGEAGAAAEGSSQ